MSLQALRAAVGTPAPPSAVLDAVLDVGVKSGQLEVAGSVARRPGWRPALDARATDASDKLARRLADARWQVPTVAELEREFPGSPVRALLSHLARNGTAEPIDAERYAAKGDRKSTRLNSSHLGISYAVFCLKKKKTKKKK